MMLAMFVTGFLVTLGFLSFYIRVKSIDPIKMTPMDRLFYILGNKL